MPEFKQPTKLESICFDNICENITSYWFRENSDAKKIIDSPKLPLYVLGSPFENLKDDQVEYILKRLYNENTLKCSYFILFFHYRTKRIDLSFITHKKISFVNSYLSQFIGNMCINVTDLNLKCHSDLKPADISTILRSMRKLRKLNLSHTKANIDVARLIAQNCLKLEYLDLENCSQMFEYCIELIIDSLHQTLQYLNIDFIRISKDLTEKIILNCKRLQFFHVNNLAEVINKLYIESITCEDFPIKNFKLTKFNIDSDTVLKPEFLNSINEMCPQTKSMILNCTGVRSCFSSLVNFKCLTELVVANQDCMISFKFDGYLLEALRNSIGRQLKLLHFVHVTDVNLRSIAKYCPNLVSLNVEFLDYYAPAKDDYGEYDTNNNKIYRDYIIQSLRSLSISNNSIKEDRILTNMGQFKQDLTLLLSNGRIKNLELTRLNDLNDEYFQCLFSTKTKEGYLLHQNLISLTFSQMKNISSYLIYSNLLCFINSLKYLNLIDCKKISKVEASRFTKFLKLQNFDCILKWS